MATLNTTFDATQVEPQSEFAPLPAGEYLAMIPDSEVKPTKKGQGEYLLLYVTIIDGPYKGRVVFDRLNLWNQNQQAVDIAQRQLSALCHAVGVMQVTDSQQLHDKPFVVNLAYEEGKNGYDAQNRVKAYKPYEGAPAPAQPVAAGAPAPAPAQQPVAAQQPAAAAAQPGGRPAWARKTG